LEALSAYLDGQLTPKERSRLEKKLQASADLRAAMEEMRRTRAVLRSQPRLRAPRNFTLTPEMAGLRKQGTRSTPFSAYFGLASALANVFCGCPAG
jgi:anti-sigma factor RsiW